MKKIIATFVVVIGMLIVSAPQAEANPISDAGSSAWNAGKDVATDAAHVLGGVIEPVVDFVKKSSNRVVMVAVDHPVQTGIGLAMIVATVAVPPLLSVDGEVLATAVTVETAEVVAGAEEVTGEAVAVVESTTESQSSVVTEERCYVALNVCGDKVAPDERDAKRVLTTAQKEALKDRACGPKWCTSELTGKRFPRSEAHIDHIVPHARGGNTSIANSQVISRAENLAKGAKLPA